MLLRAIVGTRALRYGSASLVTSPVSIAQRQWALPLAHAGNKQVPQISVWVARARGGARGFASSSSSSSSRRAAQEAEKAALKERNRRALIYFTGIAVAWIGISYAAVPLYKIFCQMTGFGGTTQRADVFVADKLTPREDARPIRVTFDGGVSGTMPWTFRPQQRDLLIVPGETALAFFTAKNKTDKPITGVATYNVYPPKTGVYFNKIQCFCFEEQRLKANEEIDMPVFFFIDPEFCEDPSMSGVHNITLSYTFFKTDDVSDEEVDDDEE
jgi:cytochrome c oxidase assembly protein subunit 11